MKRAAVRPVSAKQFFDAARSCDMAVLQRALLENPDFVALVDDRRRTALHVCARTPANGAGAAAAALSAAKLLVKAGSDVNAVQPIEDDGEIFPARPLWYALVWGKNRALGSWLLTGGADPNDCLFGLAYADDLVGAKLVRRRGARLDDVFAGETPLIYAARHRRAGFMEWLARAGADATIADRGGFSALHHAVRRRLPDSSLEALVKHGADVHARAADGTSVADLATRHQKKLLGLT